MSKSKNSSNIMIVAGKLFVICAVVAIVVSTVNYYTSKVIARNTFLKEMEMLSAAMPGDYEFSEIPTAKEDTVIYEALTEDTRQGYCVKVTVNGYSGPIKLIVGFTTSCSVSAVELVSGTETPGIGTKALESSYLNSYKGFSVPIEFSKDAGSVSQITGATITSNAVKDGINKAMNALLDAVLKGEQK